MSPVVLCHFRVTKKVGESAQSMGKEVMSKLSVFLLSFVNH